jgi:AhpD family alkylhydroperoxidase
LCGNELVTLIDKYRRDNPRKTINHATGYLKKLDRKKWDQDPSDNSGLERNLLDLVKIRASQINGCAYCIVMHTNDARKHGESDEWMHLLNAWQEAPIFSARERAALAWTEAVTKIADRHVPNEVYDETRRHFSEKELVGSYRRGGCNQRLEPGRDRVSRDTTADDHENRSVIQDRVAKADDR